MSYSYSKYNNYLRSVDGVYSDDKNTKIYIRFKGPLRRTSLVFVSETRKIFPFHHNLAPVRNQYCSAILNIMIIIGIRGSYYSQYLYMLAESVCWRKTASGESIPYR